MAISYDINQLKTNNINPVSTPMNMPKIYLHLQNYISDAAFLEEVPLTRSLSSNPSLPGCSGSAVSLPLGDWGKATMTQFTKAPLLLIWKLPHPSSSPPQIFDQNGGWGRALLFSYSKKGALFAVDPLLALWVTIWRFNSSCVEVLFVFVCVFLSFSELFQAYINFSVTENYPGAFIEKWSFYSSRLLTIDYIRSWTRQ